MSPYKSCNVLIWYPLDLSFDISGFGFLLWQTSRLYISILVGAQVNTWHQSYFRQPPHKGGPFLMYCESLNYQQYCFISLDNGNLYASCIKDSIYIQSRGYLSSFMFFSITNQLHFLLIFIPLLLFKNQCEGDTVQRDVPFKMISF